VCQESLKTVKLERKEQGIEKEEETPSYTESFMFILNLFLLSVETTCVSDLILEYKTCLIWKNLLVVRENIRGERRTDLFERQFSMLIGMSKHLEDCN
jgi:hypothetical protein